jgi:hypothetical protein
MSALNLSLTSVAVVPWVKQAATTLYAGLTWANLKYSLCLYGKIGLGVGVAGFCVNMALGLKKLWDLRKEDAVDNHTLHMFATGRLQEGEVPRGCTVDAIATLSLIKGIHLALAWPLILLTSITNWKYIPVWFMLGFKSAKKEE